MLKEATYKEKFQILDDWMPEIIEAVKKDLKNDHLKKDWLFVKRYFGSKNLNKVTHDEFVSAYKVAINEEEKGEELAEFISNCWLLKNGELYHYFEDQLAKINPEFSEIETLEPQESEKIAKGAVDQFGAYKTYLFTVLNSVVFQEKDLNHLKDLAKNDFKKNLEEVEENFKNQSIEDLKKAYELKISRLQDKYEKKILGLQKKYQQDTESYKKQIANFQSKLAKHLEK